MPASPIEAEIRLRSAIKSKCEVRNSRGQQRHDPSAAEASGWYRNGYTTKSGRREEQEKWRVSGKRNGKMEGGRRKVMQVGFTGRRWSRLPWRSRGKSEGAERKSRKERGEQPRVNRKARPRENKSPDRAWSHSQVTTHGLV